MSDCKECKHSKFDEVWGAFKCLLRKRKHIQSGDIANCSEFKPKKKEKKE